MRLLAHEDREMRKTRERGSARARERGSAETQKAQKRKSTKVQDEYFMSFLIVNLK